MRPTGLTSDTFKFHIRRLIGNGYVEKTISGSYRLTVRGKEYANNLDEIKRSQRKQPKLSVFIVASRKRPNGEIEYLLFKRARNPFIGYWTGITDSVLYGETFEERAAARFLRQTEQRTQFSVHSIRRIRDYAEASHELLEDKCFIVMIASDLSGEPKNNYTGGYHAWLTMDELLAQDKYFPSTVGILQNLTANEAIVVQDQFHSQEVY
jgi:hypothetical protein